MKRDWIDDIDAEVSGMAKNRRELDMELNADSSRVSATADLLLADVARDWVRYKRRGFGQTVRLKPNLIPQPCR